MGKPQKGDIVQVGVGSGEVYLGVKTMNPQLTLDGVKRVANNLPAEHPRQYSHEYRKHSHARGRDR